LTKLPCELTHEYACRETLRSQRQWLLGTGIRVQILLMYDRGRRKHICANSTNKHYGVIKEASCNRGFGPRKVGRELQKHSTRWNITLLVIDPNAPSTSDTRTFCQHGSLAIERRQKSFGIVLASISMKWLWRKTSLIRNSFNIYTSLQVSTPSLPSGISQW